MTLHFYILRVKEHLQPSTIFYHIDNNYFVTDFAKDLRIPKFMVPPASMRIYRNSTARYATQSVKYSVEELFNLSYFLQEQL